MDSYEIFFKVILIEILEVSLLLRFQTMIFYVRVFPANLFLRQAIKKVLMMDIVQKEAICFFVL